MNGHSYERGKDFEVVTAVVDLDTWNPEFEEPSGETDKQWLRDPETEKRWLYKPNKPGRSVDEASSEYAASLIARLLEVPAATVRIGIRSGILGCISLNVVSSSLHGLVDGATFLSAIEDDFDPKDKSSRGHTQTNIAHILADLDPPSGSPARDSAEDTFADYLMFDAFIGNTDRHSKNWAIETRLEGREMLAKSFDHATSLGVTMRGSARERLLADPQGIPIFAERAFARRFEEGQQQTLVDYGARFLDRFAPARVLAWVERLETIDMGDVHEAVTSSKMSPEATTLALSITTINRERILRCLKSS